MLRPRTRMRAIKPNPEITDWVTCPRIEAATSRKWVATPLPGEAAAKPRYATESRGSGRFRTLTVAASGRLGRSHPPPNPLLLITTPPINRNKEKKPNYINKMPIPCCSFKTKMMIFCKM